MHHAESRLRLGLPPPCVLLQIKWRPGLMKMAELT
jgi:hypothetical protein